MILPCLGREQRFYSKPKEINNKVLKLKIDLEDIVHLNHNRVVFIAKMIVSLHDEPLTELKEYIFLSNVHNDAIEAFSQSAAYNQSSLPNFKGLSKLKSTLLDKGDNVETIDWFIPENMGKTYGHLSGDLNPVHTNHWLTKKLGLKKPFLQGSCTANMMIAALHQNNLPEIKKIDTKFCAPLYVGQTISILSGENMVEVVDEDRQLVAFGEVEFFR